LIAPLVHPAEALPAALRAALPFPADGFRVAAAMLLRLHGDSAAWRPFAREPYELAAPLAAPESAAPRLWTATAFHEGAPPHLAALLAGTMTSTGPRLYLWTPLAPVRGPAELLGSPETAPGLLRLWSAEGALFTEQALFEESAAGEAPRGFNQVYVTWGDREGEGPTPVAALRTLVSGVVRLSSADTSLAGRWELARRLAAAADSALSAGDLTGFARRYGELEHLLGVRRTLAPPPRQR